MNNNPVLNDKVFKKSQLDAISDSDCMTVKGTLTKTLILLLTIVVAAAYTWKVYYEAIDPSSIKIYLYGGLIVGFIMAMIISFFPKASPYLSPIYAVSEGLFLGGISAMFNDIFEEIAPNIIIQAVSITLLTALIMFTIYRKQIITVGDKFKKIIMIALTTIMVFYLGSWILSLFGVNISVLHDSSPLSIIISIIIVGVAAFSLLMDFDFIAKGSEAGAPKYMEWYGAFGLTVTLVWLYLEILKLLAKLAASRN